MWIICWCIYVYCFGPDLWMSVQSFLVSSYWRACLQVTCMLPVIDCVFLWLFVSVYVSPCFSTIGCAWSLEFCHGLFLGSVMGKFPSLFMDSFLGSVTGKFSSLVIDSFQEALSWVLFQDMAIMPYHILVVLCWLCFYIPLLW